MPVNNDQLALDHHDNLPVREIIEKHNITIAEYHKWLYSPEAAITLMQLDRIQDSRTPSRQRMKAVAARALANLATSGKTTEAVRKACHDLRQLADEIPVDPDAPKLRVFTKEHLPWFLHEHIHQLNASTPEFQPGKHNVDYWNFDPDDPASIKQAEEDYGWG